MSPKARSETSFRQHYAIEAAGALVPEEIRSAISCCLGTTDDNERVPSIVLDRFRRPQDEAECAGRGRCRVMACGRP